MCDALLNYSTSAEKSVFYIYCVSVSGRTEQEEKEGLNVRLSDLAVMFQALGCRVFFFVRAFRRKPVALNEPRHVV